MLVCPKCGRKELGKATQCRACGAALPFKTVLDMPAFGAAPERRCTLCGTGLPVLASRCPACQAPVQVRPDEVPTELVDAPEPPPQPLPALDPQQEIPTQLKETGAEHPFAEPRVGGAGGLATSMGAKTAAEIRAVFASSSDLGPPPVVPTAPPPVQETLVRRAPPPSARPLANHELATLIRTTPSPPDPPAGDSAGGTDVQARRRLEAASRAVERSAEPLRQAPLIHASSSSDSGSSGPVAGVKVALQAPRPSQPRAAPAPAPAAAAETALTTEVTAAPAEEEEAAGDPLAPYPARANAPDPHTLPTRMYPALANRVAAIRAAATDKTQPITAEDRADAVRPLVKTQSTETDLKPVPAPAAPAGKRAASSYEPTEAALPRPSVLPATLAEMPRAAAAVPIPAAPAAVPPFAVPPFAVPPFAVPPAAVPPAAVPPAAVPPAPAPTAVTEAEPQAAAVPDVPLKTSCDGCGTTLLPGTKFCHECGLPLQRPLTRAFTPLAAPAALAGPRPGQARLLRIRGSGDGAAPFAIVDDTVQIGRSQGQLRFADDPWTSPLHAQLTRQGASLRLRDLHSRNGVFLRLRKPQRLQDGDRICLGRQLLFYDESCTLDRQVMSPSDGQGTRLLASPRAADVLRVVHLYASGAYEVVQRHQRVMTLGREGCDVNFTADEHLSLKHARILRAGAFVVVEDLNSLNGTFVAIRGEVELRHGDEILIGNQVLRLEVDDV